MSRSAPIFGAPATATEPQFAHHWDELTLVAADLLARREAGYPALVASGKMRADDAADGLRIMRAIVGDWRRLIARFAPADPAAPQAARDERATTLADALDRCHKLVGKGSLDPDYATCVAALLWHEREGNSPGDLADINIALRTRADAQRDRDAA